MVKVLGVGAVLGVLVALGDRAGPIVMGLTTLAVAVVVLRAKLRGGRRVAVGHGHGAPAVVARHEAGHVAAARAIGGGSVSVRTGGGGGWTTAVGASRRASTAQWIGFLKAGQYAAGSGAGCSGDRAAIRRELRGVPAADRRRVEREGDQLARRWVRSASGQVRRDAATIERTGRL